MDVLRQEAEEAAIREKAAKDEMCSDVVQAVKLAEEVSGMVVSGMVVKRYGGEAVWW